MAITFPLSLPAVKAPARILLRVIPNVALSRSVYTYQTQQQKNAGQIWGAEITLPQLERADAEAWSAFIISLNGPEGTFLLGDPLAKTPRGAATGTPVINGAGQSGGTISTRGWSINITGILKAGDYIQISNRLYKLKADSNSNGSGVASLEIWPDLRLTAPADGTAITVSNCVGLFRLDSNEITLFSADSSKLYEIGFTAIEAL